MDLDALRSFLRVAELGSFGRAAQVLNLTQPTLGRRIDLLEHELKARLFIRHNRGLDLTPAGTALVRKARSLIRQLDDLGEETALLDHTPGGSVAVGLPPSLTRILNGPLVATYHARHPRVRLDIREGINNFVEEMLVHGEIDVAVTFATPAHKRHATVRSLAREGLVLAGTPTGDSGPIALEEIAAYPLVLYAAPNHIRWLVDVAFRATGGTPRPVAEVDSLGMILELARSGMGRVILPSSAVAADVAEGRLAARPIRGLSVTWTIAVAHDRDRSLAVQALADCIEDLARARITAGDWNATWLGG